MASETHALALTSGDQTITFDDASFNPKCCIAISTSQTVSNTTEANSTVRIGLWAEGDQQAVYAGEKVEGNNSLAVERIDTDAIFVHLNDTPIIKQEARIKSVSAGSAVIENVVVDSTAREIFFHFFDAEECCVFTDTAATSATTKAYSHANLDFDPDVIIVVATGYTSINTHRKNDWQVSLGAATSNSATAEGSAENISIGVGHDDGGNNIADVTGYDDCISLVDATATIDKQAHWSASGTNEFTLDYDVADANAYYNIFMCIKLDNAFAGRFATGSSISQDKEIEDPGFQPNTVIFMDNNHTALGLVQSTAHFNVGIANDADSPTNNEPDVAMVNSGDGGQNYNRRFDDVYSISHLHDDGSYSTQQANISTYDSLGFHVDFTVNTPTFPSRVSYLALNHSGAENNSSSSSSSEI